MTDREATCVENLQERKEEARMLIEEVASSAAEDGGCAKDGLRHAVQVCQARQLPDLRRDAGQLVIIQVATQREQASVSKRRD